MFFVYKGYSISMDVKGYEGTVNAPLKKDKQTQTYFEWFYDFADIK